MYVSSKSTKNRQMQQHYAGVTNRERSEGSTHGEKGNGSVIEVRPHLKYKTKWADILLGTRDACTHRERIQN